MQESKDLIRALHITAKSIPRSVLDPTSKADECKRTYNCRVRRVRRDDCECKDLARRSDNGDAALAEDVVDCVVQCGSEKAAHQIWEEDQGDYGVG